MGTRSRALPSRSRQAVTVFGYRRAGRERQQAARERARQGGQCTSTPRDDQVSLAFLGLPERQCIGPVVSDTD